MVEMSGVVTFTNYTREPSDLGSGSIVGSDPWGDGSDETYTETLGTTEFSTLPWWWANMVPPSDYPPGATITAVACEVRLRTINSGATGTEHRSGIEVYDGGFGDLDQYHGGWNNDDPIIEEGVLHGAGTAIETLGTTVQSPTLFFTSNDGIPWTTLMAMPDLRLTVHRFTNFGFDSGVYAIRCYRVTVTIWWEGEPTASAGALRRTATAFVSRR